MDRSRTATRARTTAIGGRGLRCTTTRSKFSLLPHRQTISGGHRDCDAKERRASASRCQRRPSTHQEPPFELSKAPFKVSDTLHRFYRFDHPCVAHSMGCENDGMTGKRSVAESSLWPGPNLRDPRRQPPFTIRVPFAKVGSRAVSYGSMPSTETSLAELHSSRTALRL